MHLWTLVRPALSTRTLLFTFVRRVRSVAMFGLTDPNLLTTSAWHVQSTHNPPEIPVSFKFRFFSFLFFSSSSSFNAFVLRHLFLSSTKVAHSDRVGSIKIVVQFHFPLSNRKLFNSFHFKDLRFPFRFSLLRNLFLLTSFSSRLAKRHGRLIKSCLSYRAYQRFYLIYFFFFYCEFFACWHDYFYHLSSCFTIKCEHWAYIFI